MADGECDCDEDPPSDDADCIEYTDPRFDQCKIWYMRRCTDPDGQQHFEVLDKVADLDLLEPCFYVFNGVCQDVRAFCPNNCNSPVYMSQFDSVIWPGYDCNSPTVTQICADLIDDCRNDFKEDGCHGEVSIIGGNPFTNFAYKNVDYQGNSLPAVILGPLSSNDNTPITSRIANIGSYGFDVKLDNWNYQGLSHGNENISFYSGRTGHRESNDLEYEFGFVDNVKETYKWVYFEEPFDVIPIVVVSQVSNNESTPTFVRVHTVQLNRFRIKIQEEQAEDGIHLPETVSYIAMEPGEGTINGRKVFAGLTNREVRHNWFNIDFPLDIGGAPLFENNPLFLAGMQSAYSAETAVLRYQLLSNYGVQVKVQEETSVDSEMSHTTQIVGFILIETTEDCDCNFNLQDLQVFHPACGHDNGSIDIQPDGGRPPYSYNWSNGETSNSIDELGGGDYWVTITDSEGCEMDTLISLLPILGLNMEFVTITHPSCISDDGSITIYPLGGIEPYSYTWNTGSTDQTIENLGPGYYTVTVTDSEGCSGNTSFNLEYLNLDEYEIQDPICDQSNGSIIGTPMGGRNPYTYSWSNGSITQTITSLSPGTYTLTVTDNVGCTTERTFVLENGNSLNITSSGGDEGLVEGKYLLGGTEIFWYFDPKRISDQLIIESDVNGVLLNTGRVSDNSSCGCDESINPSQCDCSDLFLGDHSNQTVSLVVGSGDVTSPSGSCTNSSTPRSSYAIQGSIIIPSDGNITITGNGSVCGTTGTGWVVQITCSGSGNSPENIALRHDLIVDEDGLTGIEEELNDRTFRVYPNPTTEFITVRNSNFITNYDLQVLDIAGRTVIQIPSINDDIYKMDASNLDDGVYLIKLMDGENTYVFKIIKQ